MEELIAHYRFALNTLTNPVSIVEYINTRMCPPPFTILTIPLGASEEATQLFTCRINLHDSLECQSFVSSGRTKTLAFMKAAALACSWLSSLKTPNSVSKNEDDNSNQQYLIDLYQEGPSPIPILVEEKEEQIDYNDDEEKEEVLKKKDLDKDPEMPRSATTTERYDSGIFSPMMVSFQTEFTSPDVLSSSSTYSSSSENYSRGSLLSIPETIPPNQETIPPIPETIPIRTPFDPAHNIAHRMRLLLDRFRRTELNFDVEPFQLEWIVELLNQQSEIILVDSQQVGWTRWSAAIEIKGLVRFSHVAKGERMAKWGLVMDFVKYLLNLDLLVQDFLSVYHHSKPALSTLSDLKSISTSTIKLTHYYPCTCGSSKDDVISIITLYQLDLSFTSKATDSVELSLQDAASQLVNFIRDLAIFPN